MALLGLVSAFFPRLVKFEFYATEFMQLRPYLLTHVPDPVALFIRHRLFRSAKGFRHWLSGQSVGYQV